MIEDSMSAIRRPYDIVLWGATGFTGKLVAHYLVNRGLGELRLALGGRDRAKLEALRTELSALDQRARDLPILVGDSFDRDRLAEIAAQTTVLCSTVGPYSLFGEDLVAACVEQKTHYCDLTGEVPFIRQTIDRHHHQAAQDGTRIVHCCGFDSIPSDLGVWILQQEAIARTGKPCPDVRFVLMASRGSFSGGTVASLLHMVEEAGRNRKIRRLLADPYALVVDEDMHGNDVGDAAGLGRDQELGVWTGPFIMAGINTRVVRRTNALLGLRYGRNFRYSERMAVGRGVLAPIRGLAMIGGLGGFLAAVKFRMTRALLERWVLPAPGEGPGREERERGFFSIRIHGRPGGVSGPLMQASVKGHQDPGYAETAKMLGESALCLAFDQLESAGGVLTPAAAMGEAIIERLSSAGMDFEVDDVSGS